MRTPARFVLLLAAASLVPCRPAAGEPPRAAAPPQDEAPPAERLTLPAGTVLRPLATPVAPPLATLPAAAAVEVVERDGGWLRVRWEETTGWVEAPRAGATAAEPLAAELAAARSALGEGTDVRPAGPFSLLTDVDGALAEGLGELAAEVTATYAGRYGLPTPTEEAGVVVLFAGEADYRDFARRLGTHGLAGQTRGRLAALHVGDRGRHRVSRLLIHELAHLLNRAAFGEPLPPWLDEGLAGDLELFTLTADGRLGDADPNRLDLGSAERPQPYGPLFALPRLAGDAALGRLPGLAALAAFDHAAFLDPLAGTERYALAAFWVRYLVSGEDGALAPPFRAWMATRALGGELDAATLLARLDQEAGFPAERLDAGFRRWLGDTARRLGLAPARR